MAHWYLKQKHFSGSVFSPDDGMWFRFGYADMTDLYRIADSIGSTTVRDSQERSYIKVGGRKGQWVKVL